MRLGSVGVAAALGWGYGLFELVLSVTANTGELHMEDVHVYAWPVAPATIPQAEICRRRPRKMEKAS